MAAFVGTILTSVNQGADLLAGTMTPAQWIRAGFNYLVPFCVATYAAWQADRARRTEV